jgi:hypothetical protein
MWMALQTDGSADSTTAFTYVDWVKVYTFGARQPGPANRGEVPSPAPGDGGR